MTNHREWKAQARFHKSVPISIIDIYFIKLLHKEETGYFNSYFLMNKVIIEPHMQIAGKYKTQKKEKTSDISRTQLFS